MRNLKPLLWLFALCAGVNLAQSQKLDSSKPVAKAIKATSDSSVANATSTNTAPPTTVDKIQKATFAGGCFWCMEPPFEKLPGVKSVISGFTGGHKLNPTYKEVSAGGTGHLESVQVTFDSSQITYEKLLDVYWHQIDPTDPEGQFVDKGESYKSAIFYHDEEQKKIAEKTKADLEKSGVFKKPIVTTIRAAEVFYPAEEYHQDYYKKNPIRYKYYRYGSGRDQFLEKTWGIHKR